jgi:hypothetical protein
MKRLLLFSLLLVSVVIPASAQLPCMFTTAPTTEGTATITSDNYGIGLIGIEISVSCTTSTVAYNVVRPDDTNTYTYDLGLYCQSGTCTAGKLYVHTGAVPGTTFAPATAIVTQPWSQSAVLLPAGVYAVGVGTTCSGSASCAQISGDSDSGMILPFFVGNGGAYSGGLPSSIASPTISPVASSATIKMPSLLIY